MADKLLFFTLALALGSLAPAAIAQNANAQNADQAWVTAWGTSQQALGETKITNATVRMVARVTIPGESVKVRLDNTFGAAPAVFGNASIGPRVRGPALAAGMVKPLTFGGKNAVTIPPAVRSKAIWSHFTSTPSKTSRSACMCPA
jgi:hypothetical protein